MIYDIELSNIYSIKESIVFSMEATATNVKRQNYIELSDEEHKCLKVGIIYGPNASGKTNLLKALDNLKDIIMYSNNTPEEQGVLQYLPFYLHEDTVSRPSKIVVRLVLDTETSAVYRYSISYDSSMIIEETLSREEKGKEDFLFKREIQVDGTHIVVLEDGIRNTELPQKQVRKNQAILSYLQALNVPYVTNVALALTQKLQLANNYNQNMQNKLWEDAKRLIANNPKYRDRLDEFLRRVGTGVNGFVVPDKDAAMNTLTFKHQQKTHSGDYSPIFFNQHLESLGTRTLFLLGVKIIEALDKGYTLFVDELDSPFHTYITQYIIKMFQDERLNKKHAQLIMTTHDVQLMNERQLRLDQIWLMEKKEDASSSLVSLADFKDVDENTHIAEWYMAKRFGGVPDIEPLITLFQDETD